MKKVRIQITYTFTELLLFAYFFYLLHFAIVFFLRFQLPKWFILLLVSFHDMFMSDSSSFSSLVWMTKKKKMRMKKVEQKKLRSGTHFFSGSFRHSIIFINTHYLSIASLPPRKIVAFIYLQRKTQKRKKKYYHLYFALPFITFNSSYIYRYYCVNILFYGLMSLMLIQWIREEKEDDEEEK